MAADHPERHKFIIPHLIRDQQRDQPGLEVNSASPFETQASSPEVLRAPAHLRRSESQQYLRSPDESLPQRLESTASRRSRYDGDSHVSPSDREPRAGLGHSRERTESSRMERFKVEDLSSYRDASPSRRSRSRRRSPRRILGLPVVWFWVMMVALVVIIAIGLGVGISTGMTNASKKNSPTQTSPANATSTASGQGISSPAPTNQYCPSGNGSVVTPFDASGSIIQTNENSNMQFTMLCNTYWPSRKGINPGVRDIMAVYAPDMLTCLTLCAEYNQGYSDAIGDDVGVGGGMCVGVSLVRGPAEFCYLKNATGINNTSAAGGNPVDSALLVGNWSVLTPKQQKSIFAGFAVEGTVFKD